MQRLDISLVIIQKTLDYKKSQRSFASNTNNSKNAQRLAFFWGPGQQFFSLFCICFHLHLHSLFCFSCRIFFFALPVFIFNLRICVAAFGRNDSYFWWLVSLGVSFFAITIRTRWCEWRRYPLLVCAPLFFHCFLTRYFPFFLIVVGNRHNNHIIYEHTYALFSLFAGF